MTRQDMLERKVEAQLTKMVEKHRGISIKLLSANRNGIPDRLILFPHGYLIFIETKRPSGGTIAPLQRVWKRRLETMSQKHEYVFTPEDVEKLENRYLLWCEEFGYDRV